MGFPWATGARLTAKEASSPLDWDGVRVTWLPSLRWPPVSPAEVIACWETIAAKRYSSGAGELVSSLLARAPRAAFAAALRDALGGLWLSSVTASALRLVALRLLIVDAASSVVATGSGSWPRAMAVSEAKAASALCSPPVMLGGVRWTMKLGSRVVLGVGSRV